ncbi:phospho-N-acetylmuramoyl-pentapeptide-transferase [Enterobacteriaceae endosymbiont of Plateumaris consimilis]|uniref:phospho-N-acetylmuramoyl-pentapeptide- transferase n=1 Tax=Enterobacteriaceae endosymbiont of Plateumaris consimilis TaxID=2675794 RepID=UPI001449B99A|nr:phospho-N-acetylmuramoyl-pentapeptide-transferase [Enterobacteriaceae endosymbiont of Plateumaris consimilis]QJC28553.1 phospho-N-acetylmuramoyl-pentapeptide-transferase [Enterobacteriaceae endosymbiont of Plateumaris consimilis]
MIIILIKYLKYYFQTSNFFINFTFRAIISLLTSFIISLYITPYFIIFFQKKKYSQVIRLDGPKSHFKKNNIPTMGGIIILISFITSVIFWSDLYNPYLWYVLITVLFYALVGFIDDYYKIILDNSIGLVIYEKIFLQTIITITIITLFYINNTEKSSLQFIIPFFKNIKIYLNFITYLIISYLIILWISNSVNLTDGLDGMAIISVILVVFGLAFLSYITGDIQYSKYFHLPYLKYTKELVIICTTIIGSGLGFLWFNTYPATIFMGDIGSLSLGSAIGIITVLIRQEILLLIMGGIFLFESLSVIIQVFFYKYKKYRVFLMAPIHHHFELKGHLEPHIVIRFGIISLILLLITLSILKVS